MRQVSASFMSLSVIPFTVTHLPPSHPGIFRRGRWQVCNRGDYIFQAYSKNAKFSENNIPLQGGLLLANYNALVTN